MEHQSNNDAPSTESITTCKSCNEPLNTTARFCNKCGSKADNAKKSVESNYSKRLSLIFGFYFTLLLLVSIIRLTEWGAELFSQLAADITYAIITIGFVIQNFSEIKNLIRLPSINWKILAAVICSAIAFGWIVSIVSNFLNQSLFDQIGSKYYYAFIDSDYPLLWTVISVAVFPAIFEELGFRGVLFNHIIKISNANAAVIISSLLFTVMHLSFISLLWILPIGLAFAYLRNKYNTLFYGMVGHFTYNAFIVMYEFYFEGIY
jgi:membrane protease YdiL (CAAX protease family)